MYIYILSKLKVSRLCIYWPSVIRLVRWFVCVWMCFVSPLSLFFFLYLFIFFLRVGLFLLPPVSRQLLEPYYRRISQVLCLHSNNLPGGYFVPLYDFLLNFLGSIHYCNTHLGSFLTSAKVWLVKYVPTLLTKPELGIYTIC